MKFCGQCGSSIPDDAFACPYCGAIQGRGHAPAPVKKSFGDTLKAFVQKNKMIVIAAGGVLAALLVLVIALALFGTSYKTPINYDIKLENASKLDIEKNFINMYDGLGKRHLKKIYKIISSSDNFNDLEDSLLGSFDDTCDSLEDTYGKNYKYSVKIEDKDDMTNSTLRSFKEDYFKYCGRRLMDEGDSILDLDSEDLRDLADEMGIEKDDLRTLGKELKELGKELKNASVKKGYYIDVNVRIKGSDDEDDYDTTYSIVKADGKWVDAFTIDDDTLLNYLEAIGYYL